MWRKFSQFSVFKFYFFHTAAKVTCDWSSEMLVWMHIYRIENWKWPQCETMKIVDNWIWRRSFVVQLSLSFRQLEIEFSYTFRLTATIASIFITDFLPFLFLRSQTNVFPSAEALLFMHSFYHRRPLSLPLDEFSLAIRSMWGHWVLLKRAFLYFNWKKGQRDSTVNKMEK